MQDIKADKPNKKMQSNNDFNYSALLNTPKKIDSWFLVIDDMTNNFCCMYGKLPNEGQAWGELCQNPPAGYSVSTGKDKGENCLFMPSVKLSRSAFKERWKRYTTSHNKQ